MENEKFQTLINFAQFLLGTVALGLVTLFVNNKIQEREIEIKEQEQIGTLIEKALDENVEARLRLARYYSNVSRSEDIRDRWNEYKKDLENEVDQKKKLVEKKQKEIDAVLADKGANPTRLEELKSERDALLDEITPTNNASANWFTVLSSLPSNQPEQAIDVAEEKQLLSRKLGLPYKISIYKTKISKNYAVVIGGELTQSEASRLARSARESGLAPDAFAQKDREWIVYKDGPF